MKAKRLAKTSLTNSEKRVEKKYQQRRLKKYLHFLKKNPDWDYSAIIDLLRFKLKMVRTCISRNKNIVKEEIELISLQIKEVENFLQRVLDDNYYSENLVEYEKRYGKVEYKLVKIQETKTRRLEVIYHVADDLKAEAEEEHTKLILISDEEQKADLKKAFDLMVENIWNWWD